MIRLDETVGRDAKSIHRTDTCPVELQGSEPGRSRRESSLSSVLYDPLRAVNGGFPPGELGYTDSADTTFPSR